MNLFQHLQVKEYVHLQVKEYVHLQVKEYVHLQVKEYVVLWAGAQGLSDSVHVACDIWKWRLQTLKKHAFFIIRNIVPHGIKNFTGRHCFILLIFNVPRL